MRLPKIKNSDDVRVVDLCGRARFACQILDLLGFLTNLKFEDLQSHLALERKVYSSIRRAHASLAEKRGNLVLIKHGTGLENMFAHGTGDIRKCAAPR